MAIVPSLPVPVPSDMPSVPTGLPVGESFLAKPSLLPSPSSPAPGKIPFRASGLASKVPLSKLLPIAKHQELPKKPSVVGGQYAGSSA